MNKCKILVLFIFLSFSFFYISHVEAHIEETAGSITVTMHIEPADEPAVNTTSTIEFIIDDTTNKFDITKCQCNISISNAGNILLNQDVKNLSIPFYFPAKASYDILLTGNPLIQDQFSSFELSFSVDVKRDEGTKLSFWDSIKNSHLFHEGHWIHILLFGSAIIISIYVIVTDKKT